MLSDDFGNFIVAARSTARVNHDFEPLLDKI